MGKGHHVLLTGPSGIGKTTLVQKVVEELVKRKLTVSGFYTEEIRDPTIGKRTGFQVVTLDGKRAILASIQSNSRFKVGNYGVEITEFENSAIPSINAKLANVIVIDEIGKMELFSNPFKSAVEKAFCLQNTVILATIPIPKGKPIPFVEKIRNMPNAKLFTVDRGNRDNLSIEVIKVLLGSESPDSVPL